MSVNRKSDNNVEFDADSTTFLLPKDDALLAELGYQQQMRQSFNMWSMTAFCFSGLGLMPSLGGMV
jgi:hypothetical protein